VGWPTILIVFVSLYTVFNTVNPPSEQLKRAERSKVESEISRSDYENLIKPSYTYVSLETDYMRGSEQTYQTIVSYIMEYNRALTLNEVTAIAEAAVRYGIKNNVDPLLLTAQMSAESSFNRMAVSPSGARGLGQMMPFNFETYNITDPHDIDQGVRAQAEKMRWLLDMWEGNLNYALASYYQGHNAIRANIGRAFREDTQQYLDRILGRYQRLKNFS
jgi:soluble lytic murein transglycosylase-like protein